MGALVDRIGHAYGLDGTHAEWARASQDDLASRIAAALPATLEKYDRDQVSGAAAGPAMKSMDDAFKAGSQGGPAFSDDLVMGMPSKGPPKWIFALIAGAVLVGALVFFLVRR
jgi:hypothetical protein